VIVKLNGGMLEELDRTVVLLKPKYILIREGELPALLKKSRSIAFGVLPAVRSGSLGFRKAKRVLSCFAESPDHIIAIVDDAIQVKYDVSSMSDILPLHIRLYLELKVPEEVGPLALAFKRADAEAKELKKRLSKVSTERAIILDRINVERELAPKLSQLAEEESSLRRRLQQTLMERRSAWAALSKSLEAVGFSYLLGKFPAGMLNVSIPLLKRELEVNVKRSAASAALFIYRHVLKLLGLRRPRGLFEDMALHRLIRDINLARVCGAAESAVWVVVPLKVRAGERFTASLSLSGNSDGTLVINESCMPDVEALPQMISDMVRNVFSGELVVRAEDVEKVLGHIKPVGESIILLPVELRAVLSFKPGEAETHKADGT
jgi:cell division protein ZapA (FtsZ GTPase activity inhibitor)